MKRNIYFLLIAVVMTACNSLGKSEKAIQEYMREQTGTPELEIEFANVQSRKMTVKDSMDILQELFEKNLKEKAEQTKRIEGQIEKLENDLKGVPVNHMYYSFFKQNVEMSKAQLKGLNEKVITNEKVKYEGQDENRVLAVIVDCQMTSLVNPILKAKQTKDASFMLSADGSKCIRQLN